MANRENNAALRALFTLPPIKESASTALAVPEMPKETVTTGDREVDAVLWLQAVVQTGHQAYIDKALEAVKLIKTPMKTLANRYSVYLRESGAHMLQVAFATIGFGELESKAEAAIEKAQRRHEALARFGTEDALFADTPAEKACKKALRGVKRGKNGYYDQAAYERFNKRPELTPHTIDDCIHVRTYGCELSRIRSAVGDVGDGLAEAYAHESYCLYMLSQIAPRNEAEALSAFDHLIDCDSMDSAEAPAILSHLISKGWKRSAELENALKGLSDMYGSAWDTDGGGLVMFDSGKRRFEAAHKEARRVLGIELTEVTESGEFFPEHEVVTVPVDPPEAFLRPFLECPLDELKAAWAAMVVIARDTEINGVTHAN